MIYAVYFNGISIHGEGEDMTLLSPAVETELNTAGSFEFKMPDTHKYWELPTILSSDVEVYENDILIWFGRPTEIKIDWFNQKVVYCEGALAYFNDSIQRPKVFEDVLLHDFFEAVVNSHNDQVPANRQFKIGTITIANRYIYRELNYETTMDVLKNMCLDTDGGYFFIRKEIDGIYIDWLKDMPYSGDQPIQFALNMLDLNQNISGSELKTAVIPLGKETDGVRLTVESVNNGYDYIESEAVATYGRITAVLEYDDIDDPLILYDKALSWLTDQQFDNLSIECDAAELHYIDASYSPFRVGQMVHCASTPHLINKDLPMVKISLKLDTAVKKITIGTLPKQTLTEIYSS